MQTLSRMVTTMPLAALFAFGLAACSAAAPPPTSQPTTAAATTAPAAPAAPTVAAAAPTVAAAAPTVAAAAPVAMTRLNLNEVTEEQLLSTIPDFSGRMVREFFEYRPYISIQQFRQEIGKYVSAEQVAAYEQYVYVPIVSDESDAATLQQIPGVDATEAEALIAGRPYGSPEAFLAALAQYVSPEELAAASGYLAD